MGLPPDENLPEVVPDHSPQVLSAQEAGRHRGQFDEPDPKYPVFAEDSPKFGIIAPAPTRVLTHHEENTSVVSPQDTIPWAPRSAVDKLHAGDGTYGGSEKGKEAMICGLRRKIFWLLVGVVLVIVAAIIGGGVGGGIAGAKAREGQSSDSSAPLPPPTGTSPTSPSGTTKPTPLPSFLNNQTVPTPGFAFQGFVGNNYTGNATSVIRDEGFRDFPYNLTSYVWIPNGTSCCITFCTNLTYAGGWWCQERRQPKSSAAFPRVWIGCGEEARKEHSCS